MDNPFDDFEDAAPKAANPFVTIPSNGASFPGHPSAAVGRVEANPFSTPLYADPAPSPAPRTSVPANPFESSYSQPVATSAYTQQQPTYMQNPTPYVAQPSYPQPPVYAPPQQQQQQYSQPLYAQQPYGAVPYGGNPVYPPPQQQQQQYSAYPPTQQYQQDPYAFIAQPAYNLTDPKNYIAPKPAPVISLDIDPFAFAGVKKTVVTPPVAQPSLSIGRALEPVLPVPPVPQTSASVQDSFFSQPVASHSSDPFFAPSPNNAPNASSHISDPFFTHTSPALNSTDPFAPAVKQSSVRGNNAFFGAGSAMSDDPFFSSPSVVKTSDPFSPNRPGASDPFAPTFGAGAFDDDPFQSGSGAGKQSFSDDLEITWDAPAAAPSAAMEKLRSAYGLKGDDEEERDTVGKGGARKSGFGSYVGEVAKPKSGGASTLKEGRILARLSAVSMITSKWDDVYWSIHNGSLMLYATEDERNLGRNAKKQMSILPNWRVLPLKLKEYSGKGALYNFMLEEVRDYGPTNIGKFASTERTDADRLSSALKEEVNDIRKGVSRH